MNTELGSELFPPRVRYWECPHQCGFRDRTTKGGNIQHTHACRERAGMYIPMQEAGRHGLLEKPRHVVLVARGDMSNGDQVQRGGIMAAHSFRPDGSHDTVVFAPPARSTGSIG